MSPITRIAAALLAFGLAAGCAPRVREERVVPPETTPVKYPGFTRPHVAIQEADWVRETNSATPQRGKIPRGDYVLFAQQSDTPLPSSTEAVYYPVGVVQVRPEQFSAAAFTHRVRIDTPWYEKPAQSRVETGILLKGTEVVAIRDAGTYSEVFVSNGVRGFVRSDALERR